MQHETRCIGIVGGMSPESTVLYYQSIIRRHQRERHDHAYPRVVIASVSFAQYVAWQHAGAWARIAAGLTEEFRAVAAAGADFALLATNTMHMVLPDVRSPIPIVSIVRAVAAHATRIGVTRVGLTGTRFTMSDGFYARALEACGVAAVVPEPAEQETIHRIIYDELIRGDVRATSRALFADICARLVERGAEAILLGCTELELLAGDGDLAAPSLPSTRIHADLAWEIATGACAIPR